MSYDTADKNIEPVPYSRNIILCIVSLFPLVFILIGLAIDTPAEIFSGMVRILTSRDTLITDYMGLGGIGAAFINAGLLTLIAIAFYYLSSANISGSAIACLFVVLGCGLFGKSLLNVWFIILGVFLYTKFKKESFSAHINTAFFGTALAPIFTEILFSTAIPHYLSLPLSILTTLAVGFVLVPTSAHLFKAHEGFNLYNIGFVGGIIGTLIVACYTSYGFVPDPIFIWTTGNNPLFAKILFVIFISMAAGGISLDRNALKKQTHIMRQSGRSPTDFISYAGLGPTLLNMSLTGAIATAYVLLVGSDLNGPTIGAILTIAGFSAFGKHPGNILPIMIGVFIGSLAKPFNAGDPEFVLAALLGTTLAPIAGRFGWHWGIAAGFLHSSVVQSVVHLHGGLVLYNNGFAAGLVAMILLPVIVAVQPSTR